VASVVADVVMSAVIVVVGAVVVSSPVFVWYPLICALLPNN
jgi:hypothetical protein